MKMIGMPQPTAARWLCSSNPFIPGICTSTTRHAVSCKWPDRRNVSADSKAAARKPKDSMSSVVVLRTDSSSSTTEIRFSVTLNSSLSSRYSQREKESIGRWSIYVLKRMMRVSFRLRGFFRGAFELLDHSYQVDKGFRVHLLHRPAALDLHGTFRSAEVTSNLFIEHAGYKHGDHLLLAGRQRVEALLEIGYFFLLFTSGTISLQCDANRIQQILVAEWLGEKFHCPSFDSADTHWNVAVAGEKDDWNMNVSDCQLALKVESTQPR